MTEQPLAESFLDATPVEARRKPPRALIVLALAIVAILAGWAYIHAAGRSVSTDNAYVRADSTIVAPKVRGLVAAVLVADNSRVAAGTPLVRLDDEEYRARLAAARADLQVADAAVDAAQAALTRLGAEQRLALANEATAGTMIRAADAEVARAIAERDRQRALLPQGFVTKRSIEAANSAATGAIAEASRARAALAGRAREGDVAGARRAELLGVLAQARATQAKAKAALDLATQDLTHALIRAPIGGTVGDRQVEAGEYVQPGTRLMRIVPSEGLYIVANFKETQTARMVAGQRAEVSIDALPDETLTGRVDSFAPGAGSEFALIPFEPGTGNFTKIVQRVGVRIRLDPGQAALKRLRPGLSAEVEVELR